MKYAIMRALPLGLITFTIDKINIEAEFSHFVTELPDSILTLLPLPVTTRSIRRLSILKHHCWVRRFGESITLQEGYGMALSPSDE